MTQATTPKTATTHELLVSAFGCALKEKTPTLLAFMDSLGETDYTERSLIFDTFTKMQEIYSMCILEAMAKVLDGARA